jgi:hypothetical protein
MAGDCLGILGSTLIAETVFRSAQMRPRSRHKRPGLQSEINSMSRHRFVPSAPASTNPPLRSSERREQAVCRA